MLINEIMDPQQKHMDKKSRLEKYLESKDYPLSVKALHFAAEYHTGTRKDGVTPEFDHQVSIVRFITKLPDLIYPDATCAVGFLHDVSEDYSIPFSEISKQFDTNVGRAVNLVTKKFDGVMRKEDKLFQVMAKHPIASVVKGVDRVHNQSTMKPFDQDKKNSYLKFSDDMIIPMLLEAQKNFPEQSRSYDMILRVLGYQKKKHAS